MFLGRMVRRSLRRLPGRLALAAVGLTAAAVATLALSGLGSRWGWWSYRAGFVLLRWAAWAGMLAAAAGLLALAVALWRRLPLTALVALLAVAVAAGVVWVPLTFQRLARGVPPIHDITTDTDNPPRFVAVLAQRGAGANPAEYAGAPVAAQQKAAYPDVAPAELAVPPEDAFERALSSARALGWEIVAAVPAEGRLEATATTFWFGFKDDVVVRITRTERGSRVDVRSLSRVGRSDLGTNARRIRAFLLALGAREPG